MKYLLIPIYAKKKNLFKKKEEKPKQEKKSADEY